MPQWVKVSATKPDDLNPIPRIHMVIFYYLSCDLHVYTVAHMSTHTYTQHTHIHTTHTRLNHDLKICLKDWTCVNLILSRKKILFQLEQICHFLTKETSLFFLLKRACFADNAWESHSGSLLPLPLPQSDSVLAGASSFQVTLSIAAQKEPGLLGAPFIFYFTLFLAVKAQ